MSSRNFRSKTPDSFTQVGRYSTRTTKNEQTLEAGNSNAKPLPEPEPTSAYSHRDIDLCGGPNARSSPQTVDVVHPLFITNPTSQGTACCESSSRPKVAHFNRSVPASSHRPCSSLNCEAARLHCTALYLRCTCICPHHKPSPKSSTPIITNPCSPRVPFAN
jgi:hypothetical protein